MKKFVYLWGPVIVFAGLMFIMSSLSFSLQEEPFALFDKFVHMSEYGLFAILLYRALSGSLNGMGFISIAFLTVIITLGYGMSDEFHQSFVPSRIPDVKDLAADGVGAIVAMAGVFIKRKVFMRFSD